MRRAATGFCDLRPVGGGASVTKVTFPLMANQWRINGESMAKILGGKHRLAVGNRRVRGVAERHDFVRVRILQHLTQQGIVGPVT